MDIKVFLIIFLNKLISNKNLNVKQASESEMKWVMRFAIIIVAIISTGIAIKGKSVYALL